MRSSIERQIRTKAALIPIIVAGICAVLILYVFRVGSGIGSQKAELEGYYNQLSRTEQLIGMVNSAQGQANLYVSTKQRSHYTRFRNEVQHIESFIDSVRLVEADSVQDEILLRVRNLLRQKGRIVMELNEQLSTPNPIEHLSETLSVYEPPRARDSIVVDSLVVYDTVFNEIRTGLFNRRRGIDTLVTSTTNILVDTLTIIDRDTAIFSQVTGAVALASTTYTNKITAIERNISRLVTSDYEITAQISGLLLALYGEVISSAFERLEAREHFVRSINRSSLIGGAIALLLIMVFIILIITDANRGHAARKALEEANVQIAKTMESRHKLLLSVSHDIKTPLGSILGYLETMNASGSSREIESMQNSGNYILSLLTNLLDFSSLEQGNLKAMLTSFSPGQLVAEVGELIAPLAARKQLRFDCDCDISPSLRVESDELKIRQILLNLLSNAVKYTSKGKITLGSCYDNNRIVVTVADTGVGIPPSYMQDLYKPFARAGENSRMAEGSGFGLFVVKGLIDLLEGEIDIKSELGKGTTVNVCIPVKELPAVDNESLPESETKMRILVVDDDLTLLSVVSSMAEKIGMECNTCGSVVTVIDKLNENYDVIITDMEMGEFSGRQMLSIVRERGIKTPVVIMTGRSDYSTSEAVEDGFNGYLPKPFSSRTLRAAIMTALGQLASDQGDWFEGEQDVKDEIVNLFIDSSLASLQKLEISARRHDFETSRSICHKMMPMFVQFGAKGRLKELLRKIDCSKNKPYNGWQRDCTKITQLSYAFLSELKTRYALHKKSTD